MNAFSQKLDCKTGVKNTGYDDNVATPGMLSGAKNAVLIIDDAHLLPKQLQEKIKSSFERGFFVLGNGEKIRTARLRLIITVKDGGEPNLIQGLLHLIVSFKIKIPALSRMSEEYSAIIDFWFRRCARQRKQKSMKMARKFKSRLIESITQNPTRVTMRSIMKTVGAAIDHAIDESRSIIAETDLLDLEFLFEELPDANIEEENKQSFSIPINDPIGIAAWNELYNLMSISSLDNIVSMARKMAIKYAMSRAKGNCSKAAEILGIARQSLYKEHLRQDTLYESRKHGKGSKSVSGSVFERDNKDFDA